MHSSDALQFIRSMQNLLFLSFFFKLTTVPLPSHTLILHLHLFQVSLALMLKRAFLLAPWLRYLLCGTSVHTEAPVLNVKGKPQYKSSTWERLRATSFSHAFIQSIKVDLEYTVQPHASVMGNACDQFSKHNLQEGGSEEHNGIWICVSPSGF